MCAMCRSSLHVAECLLARFNDIRGHLLTPECLASSKVFCLKLWDLNGRLAELNFCGEF